MQATQGKCHMGSSTCDSPADEQQLWQALSAFLQNIIIGQNGRKQANGQGPLTKCLHAKWLLSSCEATLEFLPSDTRLAICYCKFTRCEALCPAGKRLNSAPVKHTCLAG